MVRSTSTHINKSEMFTAIELKNILQLRCGSDSKSSNEWKLAKSNGLKQDSSLMIKTIEGVCLTTGSPKSTLP